MNEHVDVVVVGAGPVGLLTAIELTLAGVGVLVLERLASPSTGIKALGVGPLGSEALRRRGMASAMAEAEARNLDAMERMGVAMRGRGAKFSGHFAGLFIRRDVQDEPERRMHAVDQQSLEAVLAERAEALGIEVRRACDLTGFVQHADRVDLACKTATGNDEISCAYLVGCDGGRSSVRKMAGFAFPGTPPTMTMYQAIVEIDHPDRLLPVGWRRTEGGVFAYGPYPGRLFMLDFSGPPENREAPVTREEVEAALRRISGTDVRVSTLETANRWTDNTRLVETYRQGRVLLAGDAAHIHSPFGGQGLSLGLADAANLGWKLGAVLRDAMPDSLLDTYTAERRPVAEAVLANTLAQAAIMRPDPQSGAMREIVAKLMENDEVGRHFGTMMRGLSVRYDLGSDDREVGRLSGDRLVGEGDRQVSLYDLMQDGSGVLLDATPDQRAARLVGDATRRLRCLRTGEGPSLLIRPDACIAWVGRDDGVAGLEEALRRWFAPAERDEAPAEPAEGRPLRAALC